jgi:membrane protease YdiL (CAAX protease family)
MTENKNQGLQNIRQIFWFMSFWLGSSIFAILVMQTIAKGLGINDWQYLIQEMNKGKLLEYINHIKIISIAGHFCTYSLAAISFAYFLHRNEWFKYLEFRIIKKYINFIIIPLSIILVYPIALWVAYLNIKIIPSDWIAENTLVFEQRLMQMNTPIDFILNIILIGIVAGIGEELIFRGIVQKLITQLSKNIHIAIWGSAFLFSLIHFQPEGFIPRLVLGALFGYILIWTGNMVYSILSHIIFNSLQVVIFYLFNDKTIDVNITQPDIPLWITIIVTILFTFTLYLIYKINIPNQNDKRKYLE